MTVFGWIVGSRLGRLVAGVLLVGILLFTAIQYIRSDERDRIEIEQLRKDQETRERIDNAINDSPDNVDDAIEFLRDRQDK